MDRTAVLIGVGALVFTASPAYAYIDPGTGGILVQLLTGGVAGLLVLAKLYWHKIRAVFGFSTSRPPVRRPPEARSGDD